MLYKSSHNEEIAQMSKVDLAGTLSECMCDELGFCGENGKWKSKKFSS